VRPGRGAGLLLLLLVVVGLLLGRRRAPAAQDPALVPGSRIGDLEAGMLQAGLQGRLPMPALADPNQLMRERARALVQQDPGKAAQILKAWMTEDAPHA